MNDQNANDSNVVNILVSRDEIAEPSIYIYRKKIMLITGGSLAYKNIRFRLELKRVTSMYVLINLHDYILY